MLPKVAAGIGSIHAMLVHKKADGRPVVRLRRVGTDQVAHARLRHPFADTVLPMPMPMPRR
eukprot:2439813-Prymnesium_polylepis.2